MKHLDNPATVGLTLVILVGLGVVLNFWAYHAPV